MSPKALITGVTGQDGRYLCELLIDRGYDVTGLSNDPPVEPLPTEVRFVAGDLRDKESLQRVIEQESPSEIYNLAGLTSVAASFDDPVATCDVTGMGVVRLLEAIRNTNPKVKFFQASSAEIFGVVSGVIDEKTPLNPNSPYGVAKAFAHNMVATYRRNYGIFACCGILFNHELPRRGPNFVTRKITMAVADIKAGTRETLELGNLDVYRDWGFAGDYVRAMQLMLTAEHPTDYVIASGEEHSLVEFLELAFSYAGLQWQDHVRIDEKLLRPSEIMHMRGNANEIQKILGWQPATSFAELVAMMVDADLRLRGIIPAEITEDIHP